MSDSGRRFRLRRSGLIASQLIGLALVRYIWQIEPVGHTGARLIQLHLLMPIRFT